jgi:hypothetical protein
MESAGALKALYGHAGHLAAAGSVLTAAKY